ncbi:MAG TPA: hypothetical protein VMK12_19635 [Anaeromyxobacteraceae bacterium]|nr:hypothetical protein [Anaeromyxobacteraceae bacterium]
MRRLLAAAVAVAFLLPLCSAAGGDLETQAPADAKSREASFAVAPGPFYNPNQGLGLQVMGIAMFHPQQNDLVSPPSIAGLFGMYAVLPPLDEASTRYSFALGGGSRLYLDEDRWRLAPVVAYFDLFRQFRGIGGDTTSTQFDYRQYGVIAILQAMREVLWKKFYAGLLVGYTAFKTWTADPANQQILENLGTGAAWTGQPNFGVLAQYDTKDDQYYPGSGIDFNLRLNGSPKSGQEYAVLLPSVNQYFALVGKDQVVLAYRVFSQFGFGELPLASYAYYGSRGTALGYPSGDYVDKMMAGAEVEARWLFWWRLGLEGGVAEGKVFSSFGDFGPEPWLPSAWGSLTSQLMEGKAIRARLTAAVSKSGGALYFAVGENF